MSHNAAYTSFRADNEAEIEQNPAYRTSPANVLSGSYTYIDPSAEGIVPVTNKAKNSVNTTSTGTPVTNSDRNSDVYDYIPVIR